jgi:hypothetical protein
MLRLLRLNTTGASIHAKAHSLYFDTYFTLCLFELGILAKL